MSAASEDQFLCSICLDVFTDPVSTPCGLNFCKTCITQHWDVSVSCECPVCKNIFSVRPELKVNTSISEMVAQFRQWAHQRVNMSQQQAAQPGEVPCDVCTGPRLRALKSCLVCLSSFCETHLEPHLAAPGLKRHQLVEPVENLEGRMCTEHDRLLELFCKTDQTCICMLCTVLNHKTHDVVPPKEEYEGKKAELVKTDAEIQQMIKERQTKIQEIKPSVEASKANADTEIASSVQVFSRIKEIIEEKQDQITKMLQEGHRTAEREAEGFVRGLEQEISALEKRSRELQQLSQSKDHLNLLQNYKSLSAAPPTKDWTRVRVCTPSYEENMKTAVDQLVETLTNEVKRLLPKPELQKVPELEEVQELQDLQKIPKVQDFQKVLVLEGLKEPLELFEFEEPEEPEELEELLQNLQEIPKVQDFPKFPGLEGLEELLKLFEFEEPEEPEELQDLQ